MEAIQSLIFSFLPLFIIMWFANLAQARRQKEEPYQGLAVTAYLILIALYGLTILIGLAVHAIAFIAAIDPSSLTGPLSEMTAPFREAESITLLALGFWVPSLLGIILLLPPVRRFVANFLTIEPENPVHAVSISMSMLVIINMIVTLGLGLGSFADSIVEAGGLGENAIPFLWVQQILTALLGAIGVGWLTRRGWSQTLERLALVAPTGRQWLIGIGVGFGIVPIVLLIEVVASQAGFGADADVERLTEALFGPLFMTPLGILTIGLSAALGEETLLRGAMIPRFGLILTTVLFALLHVQYGVSLALLVIVVPALLLGWLRLRYNTSTAMITHAVYNMSLGLLAYLSANLLDI
jgi:membrane protease YdiL (CAAX protease family)